ncbi:ras-related protein Rab-37 isoform X6 [Apteryx mantelli]|uniref:Ras-related protein Rab-37 isoform X6 n=1 Tax=Apteryx mantelli TaxID=2696672 RepID=A0ABM4FHY0_9AVES
MQRGTCQVLRTTTPGSGDISDLLQDLPSPLPFPPSLFFFALSPSLVAASFSSPLGWQLAGLPNPPRSGASSRGAPRAGRTKGALQGGHRGALALPSPCCRPPTPVPAPALQVMLLGDSGVGKSCFLSRFKDGAFLSGTFIATVGIDFRNKVVAVDGVKVKLQIWDTAGQERFRSVTHAYYRDAQALLLLYDITSKISFDNIRAWLSEIHEYAQKDVVIMLLGNKADMSGERAVRTEDGASLAREYGVPFMETSAKTGLNVELAFLAVANSSPAARSRCRGAAAAGRCCTWESWDDAQLQRLRPTGIFPGPEPALPPLTCPGAALASAPLAGLSLQVYRIKAQYFRGLASACFSMREKALTPGRDVGGCRAGAAAEAGDPGGRRSPFLLARAYAADFRQSKGERGRVNTAC